MLPEPVFLRSEYAKIAIFEVNFFVQMPLENFLRIETT